MKKNYKKPDSAILMFGILLMILGFGGIGYIPGKTLSVSFLSGAVAGLGALITLFYAYVLHIVRRYHSENGRTR